MMQIPPPQMQRLMMALGGARPQPAANGARPHARLLHAMSARRGDAKYARFPALPPYGEAKHSSTVGGAGGAANQGGGSAAQTNAYQSDAFQSDAFQV